MAIGTYILTINLNVNGLNPPIKRHRLAEWIQKQDIYIQKQDIYIYIYTHIYMYIYIHAVYKKPTSDLKTHIV